MIRVFDCFTFYREQELLELRLHELEHVVDLHVLVESDKTFTGKPKALHFDAERLPRRFRKKVRHVVVTDMPQTDDPWTRERHQRNTIMRGLEDLHNTDVVVLGDVDEVPRATSLAALLLRSDWRLRGLQQRLFHYHMDVRCVGSPRGDVAWTMVARGEVLRRTSCEELRSQRHLPERWGWEKDAGWHFSFLGGVEAIQEKLGAFSHAEKNTAVFSSAARIAARMGACVDIFDRNGFSWQQVPVDVSFPMWVRGREAKLRAQGLLRP